MKKSIILFVLVILNSFFAIGGSIGKSFVHLVSDNGYTKPSNSCLDSKNNLIVSGFIDGTNLHIPDQPKSFRKITNSPSEFVMKLDALGNLKWLRTVYETNGEAFFANSVIDKYDNIYLYINVTKNLSLRIGNDTIFAKHDVAVMIK